MRQLKHLSLLLGLLLLGPSSLTFAQSVRFQSQAISSRGAGIANATVAVCTQPSNTNTQPCSPLATLATSTSTTSGGANPLTADSFGNFFFYAAPGRYTVQIYGPAVSGQFVIPDVEISSTAGGSPLNGECAVTSTASLSAANTLCSTSSTKIHIWPGLGIVSGAGLTIAAQLQVDAGSQISGSPIINGAVLAGDYQIFTGTPTIAPLQPLHALWFPGADMLAQISAAYSAQPAAPTSNTILVPANPSGGCWTATTAITLNSIGKYATIQGTGPGVNNTGNVPGGACVNYTPTTATTAITIDWAPTAGGGFVTQAIFKDFTLTNGTTYMAGGSGSSATGIACGTTNAGMHFGYFQNLNVRGFGTGLACNNGLSFGMLFTQFSFAFNTTGVNIPSANEVIGFQGGIFGQNGTAANMVSTNCKFRQTHFDANTVAGVTLSGSTGSACHFIEDHFETNPSSTTTTNFINSTGPTIDIADSEALDDTVPGTGGPTWFTGLCIGAKNLTLTTSGRTPTQVFLNNDGTCTDISVILPSAGTSLAGLIVPNVGNRGQVSIVGHALNPSFNTMHYLTEGGAINPTCTFTSGGGTTPACAFGTNSSDSSGTIIATTGTGAPAASGTITLTFGSQFGQNALGCVYALSLNGAGQWNARATVMDKTPSVNSDLFQWDNNAIALGTSTAFQINYWCIGR